MRGRRVRAIVGGLVVAHVVACGDDLPDPPELTGMSSSGTTGTTGTSTTGEPASTGTTLAPASSDEGGGTTTTTGHTTVGIPDECTVTAECSDGEPFCVAPFDQSAGPEGKGAFECVSDCVAIMDEARWCADAAACCDPLAECTDRGYCVYPDGSTGGSETGGSETGGTTGGGSETGGSTG